MTFYAYLAAACLGAYGAWRRLGTDRIAATVGLVLSACCLFVAMEEISWGQRLLGFDAPAALGLSNSQGEANLHNLFLGPGKVGEGGLRRLAAGAILVYAVFLPGWLEFRGKNALLVRLPIPSAGAVPVFFAAAAALVHGSRYRVDEIGEYLLGFGMAIVLAAFALQGSRARSRGAWLASAWGIAFLLSVAPARLGWGAPAGREWSREILMYYLYSFAVERFPHDGRWESSGRLLEYAASHGFANQHSELLLARVARQVADSAGAAAYLKTAEAASAARLRAQPDAPFGLYTAALVQREDGRPEAADSLARRALSVVEQRLDADPENDVLRTLLGCLHEELGEPELAAAAFVPVANREPAYRENFRYMIWTGGEEDAAARGRF